MHLASALEAKCDYFITVDKGILRKINREKFDYTKWRKDLFEDMDITDLADKADKFSKGL